MKHLISYKLFESKFVDKDDVNELLVLQAYPH